MATHICEPLLCDEQYAELCMKVKKMFPDVQIFTDTVKTSDHFRVSLLLGGLNSGNPKSYMDNVVSEFVGGRGYNEFIEVFLDNPYFRVVLEGVNNLDWEVR